ncbi:ABC transporter substrate-binding protein [Arcanobacterium phocisimile]|uniref:ABC transporter substrate-binding protein n=1 Tax=Arcanobacterium phocisimile TaxID=1302235 RepID=A0ABX7IE96_9ACTO|nr:ABC transporter substrate-binding protein [Arcanobacterium phocisimile]QRV01466.1 ABC transporter substrate-binding protein [Arcanobacterium phocisimile]
MSVKKTRIVATLAATALALSACGGSTEEKKTDDAMTGSEGPSGVLNAGVAYETTNWSPIHAGSALANGVNWHILEGLYDYNMADYSTHPALAEGEPKEVGELTYEITLRKDAKFSDGTPVKAEDVVKSFERNSNEGGLYTPFFKAIKAVSAKDDSTVTVELNYPFAKLQERMALVKVVPAGMSDDELKTMPIGTGPYKFESAPKEGTPITAVVNEHYNGKNPAKLEKIVWNPQKDDSQRLAAALGGTIDVMEAVPAATIEELKGAGWEVKEVEGYNNPFLMFNTTKAPFDKPEVRRALIKAVDGQRLIDSALSGKAKKAKSFLPEVNPDFKEPTTNMDYSMDDAKKLLADAGVTDLNMTLLTTDHPWVANLAPQIKEDWEKLGLTVNIESKASAALYADNADVESPTYDVILAPGDPSVFGNDPAIFFSWWYGDNAWMHKRSNFANSNPEIYAQIQQLINEADSLSGADAKAKWGELQDIVAEQAPIFPLFHREMITAYNPATVDGVDAIATTGLYLLSATHK